MCLLVALVKSTVLPVPLGVVVLQVATKLTTDMDLAVEGTVEFSLQGQTVKLLH
jgi:hypothetical protein